MDFGLSVRMDTADSHVSQMFQGTITHMAPEVGSTLMVFHDKFDLYTLQFLLSVGR